MAPSPTGKLHIGTAHTTLFNFLFAQHTKGDFILRIDDSDPERSKREFEKDILDSLHWLGIYWDEGPDVGGPYKPYRQSERTEIYKKYTQQLLESKKAYRCFCSRDELEAKEKEVETKGEKYKYAGTCRLLSEQEIAKNLEKGLPYTIRLANPGKIVKFTDMVRGEIAVDSTSFGDFIIVRSDGSALLNFAVVVDDIEMKISHAVRGEDFLNATPYQILIFEALQAKPPEIANLSFIYAPDHTKLSKRHGATGISEYREMGYLPEALVNFLAFLGWNPGDDREIFTLEELISEFDFSKVQKGAPTFNKVKLDWYNQQYIKADSEKRLGERLKDFTARSETDIAKVLPLIKERLVTLKDFDQLTEYFFDTPTIEPNLFSKIKVDAKNVLEHATEILKKCWDGKVLESEGRKYCEQNGIKVGDYFMILRIALTSKTATPPLWEVMEVLGPEETLNRLEATRGMV